MSSLTLIIVIVGALALELSYLGLRRWLFLATESEEAARWYSREKGWSTRRSDVVATAAHLRRSRAWITAAALVSWVVFVVLLYQRYRQAL